MNKTETNYKFLNRGDLKKPKLFLGIVMDPDFNRGYNAPGFTYYDHQTAGLACNHLYFLGKELPFLNEQLQKNAISLHEKYYDTSIGGLGGPTLQSLNEYNEDIKGYFGVGCNITYRHFKESVYPIDPTNENLQLLTSEKLPEDLDDLVIFDTPFDKFCGCINRWNLFILGQNSD